MNTITTGASSAQALRTLLVANDDLTFREIQIMDANPTGAQVLAAAGVERKPETVLLQLLATGELESIRLDERPALSASNRFLISASDRSFYFTVDGTRLEWPHRCISARSVRVVGEVGDDRDLIVEQPDGSVIHLNDDALIDLGRKGVEAVRTRPRTWVLRVQGVALEYGEPLVKVADAMTRAGFDPKKAWHVYLMVQGQPKQEVSTDFIVDLRTPGIEKIRLMQRNVDNGDGQKPAPRRLFKLLDADHDYLNNLGLRWETVFEGERRWLLIYGYALPAGYTPQKTTLALDIHKDYPASQIDMFYFTPFISLTDGRAIPRTQVRATIGGIEFQGWSRHRNAASVWDPNSDTVRTHMALVESCLAKELGE